MKNLTNEKYYTSLVDSTSNGWVYGGVSAPRTYGLQVHKTF